MNVEGVEDYIRSLPIRLFPIMEKVKDIVIMNVPDVTEAAIMVLGSLYTPDLVDHFGIIPIIFIYFCLRKAFQHLKKE